MPCEGTSVHRDEHDINCTRTDKEDGLASVNQYRGDEATRSMELLTVLRVKTIQINSAILAVKSPYFYKLFSNGMRESERVATLQIHASEEASLMELLNFMYNNTLSKTTLSSLLDILMLADKYDVASCMRYCSQQLSKLPMTCNFALSLLDLPSSVLQDVALQQLTHSAKQFIAFQFRNMKKFENQVLNLSLTGIEAILSSDDIQVRSEDVLYDLVLKWAEVHYPEVEERREVLETRLRQLIRFPYMTRSKLKEITSSTNFGPEVASEIVLEALFFKTETPYIQHQLASGGHIEGEIENVVNTDKRFVERAYTYRPVRAVEVELPRRHCVVYLDLKRKECVRLFPSRRTRSQTFHLGRHGLFLLAYCHMDNENVSQCFGLYLGMEKNESASLTVDCEFAAWSKEVMGYQRKYDSSKTFSGGQVFGRRNLFNTSWAAFIAKDSPYFINGKLHLRAVVTVK
ncbi:BTB/POZ domain-containing protein POB1-like [Heracleum sosnowskyi]|uniref:BTB/POZ domain-containing protein POB1-like n=1 Tax=Heracleum sosnowskyi TaxID=360622 RepID=A0AAD8MF88_9APIA|nr:BTB/POZ domain-containing protein POB1-like [Heracleum sosnowskyi]